MSPGCRNNDICPENLFDEIHLLALKPQTHTFDAVSFTNKTNDLAPLQNLHVRYLLQSGAHNGVEEIPRARKALELGSEPRTPSVRGEPRYISRDVQHLGAGRLHVRRNSGKVTFQNSAAAGQECMQVLGLRHSGSRLGTIRQRVTIENCDLLEKIG
jgi:hypothetical protein